MPSYAAVRLPVHARGVTSQPRHVYVSPKIYWRASLFLDFHNPKTRPSEFNTTDVRGQRDSIPYVVMSAEILLTRDQPRLARNFSSQLISVQVRRK